MEQSPSYKRKIQIQFQAYCYKILRGEAVDYYRYVNYLQKHEKSIENLSSKNLMNFMYQMNTDQMIICLKYWNMTQG